MVDCDRTHNQSILHSHFVPLRHDWPQFIDILLSNTYLGTVIISSPIWMFSMLIGSNMGKFSDPDIMSCLNCSNTSSIADSIIPTLAPSSVNCKLICVFLFGSSLKLFFSPLISIMFYVLRTTYFIFIVESIFLFLKMFWVDLLNNYFFF